MEEWVVVDLPLLAEGSRACVGWRGVRAGAFELTGITSEAVSEHMIPFPIIHGALELTIRCMHRCWTFPELGPPTHDLPTVVLSIAIPPLLPCRRR